ncbi:MAG: carbohydrate ABC transporter permease [Clostridia bacterium]|nr:carbohydrate ABC transporter permease [Clostridia bacterium]
MIALILIGAGLFTILPLIYSISTSLKPLDEILAFPPRFFVTRPTGQNYAALPGLLNSLRVSAERYFINSIMLSVVITIGHVFIAAMAAYVFTQSKSRFMKIAFTIVQFTILFNGYTLAIPQYMIFSGMKIIDTYLVYILPALPSTIGVFLIKQFMDASLPPALIEAAKIDGAGNFRIFFTVVMPIAKPALLTLALFAFRDAWALVPSGTIFRDELRTLPQVMGQITGGGIARSGSAMAATVLLMIPPIAVYLLCQSNVLETMSNAGIKE